MADPADVARSVLAGEPGVISAYLFGSVASGRAHRFSDVDIAVLWSDALTRDEQFRRALDLGLRLEEAFNTRVDLVNLNRAAPFVAFQVLKTGTLVFDRDTDTRSLWVMRALNTYYDQQRYFDYWNACALERFQQRGVSGGQEGPGNPTS
jgi:predicted nucleotidyltransferase